MRLEDAERVWNAWDMESEQVGAGEEGHGLASSFPLLPVLLDRAPASPGDDKSRTDGNVVSLRHLLYQEAAP